VGTFVVCWTCCGVRKLPRTGDAREANRINETANSFYEQDQYPQAEAAYWSALGGYQKTLGPDHVHVAAMYDNLARDSANRTAEKKPPSTLVVQRQSVRSSRLERAPRCSGTRGLTLANSGGLFDFAVGTSILPELRGACSSLELLTATGRCPVVADVAVGEAGEERLLSGAAVCRRHEVSGTAFRGCAFVCCLLSSVSAHDCSHV
jgi:hypothetical protein